MAITFPNFGFETGTAADWTLGSGASVTNTSPYAGTYSLEFTGTGGNTISRQSTIYAIPAGQSVQAACMYQQGAAGSGQNTAAVLIQWYDASGVALSTSEGNVVTSGSGGEWKPSSVTAAAPANAAGFSVGIRVNRTNSSSSWVDNFSWNYEGGPTVELTYPITGSTFEGGAEVPFRVEIDSTATVTSVLYVVTNTNTAAVTNIGPFTESPYATNYASLPAGPYSAVARVTFEGGLVVNSAAKTFTVGAVPPPDTREFKASNSYTYLVAKNFSGLANAIPSTAQVVGMETVIDYSLRALIRSKDIDVSDVTVARYSAAFDMVPNVTFETILLDDNGATYTDEGGAASAQQAVERSDFSVVEDGTSEGKRWTVLDGDAQQITIGSSTDLFGIDSMTASEFVTKALGVRFYPNFAAKPDFADDGDACFRVGMDKLRVQIYFDAGSVEYYFVSPDGTQVIKGRLAAAYVDAGRLENGDASGIMQLASDLEIIQGTARTIEAEWTIHSSFPITTANQIGLVSADMAYNGLPTYGEVEANRSRYQFISANFYGDLTYDSIYGVNGVDRAFSYNGDFFYKIHTQPDPAKDKPRHTEFYHTHLALGYLEGRVDVSVIGQPYNFDGALGASSWAIGDSVTGLLNLSGTMLGIFGRKSIHGLAGTTVDNFATQVLSPKIGAVEYTITDMGFPVYANAYGIYTLAQTNQYGDYLGTPMSQDVSPWLRPRLIRKNTSPREVVVAWPVRAKNQYRLSFADGYVLTMTMNNGTQQAPTFSQQKYFVNTEEASLYDYDSMVSSAISSELDDGGEERIHIANKMPTQVTSVVVEGPEISGALPDGAIFIPHAAFSYLATGGVSPYTFSVESGTFPPGLTLNSDGSVTGTPSEVGAFTFVVRVVDANGLEATIEDTTEIGFAVFATRNNNIYVSPTGLTWSDSNVIAGPITDPSVIKYANDRLYVFRGGSTTQGVVSTDGGQSWTALTGLSGSVAVNDIVWTGAEYIAVTQGGTCWVSTNGVAFATRTVPVGNILGGDVHDNVVVFGSNNNGVMSSINSGATFSKITIPFGTLSTINKVMWLKDRWICFDTQGKCATSANGVAWTVQAGYSVGGLGIIGAAYDPINERVVSIVSSGATFYSDDQGVTWTAGGTTLGNSYYTSYMMVWRDGYFLYGSSTGNIYASTDAVTWTKIFDSGVAGDFICIGA